MKVLFIFPSNMKLYFRIPMGTAYLLTILTKENIDTKLYDATIPDPGYLNLKSKLKIYRPDLICISLMSTQLTEFNRILTVIRQNSSNVRIIVGGIHPTLVCEEMLVNYPVDYICLGEGELSLPAFINELEKNNLHYDGKVPGIWYKKGNDIIKTGYSDIVTDLNTLPPVNRDKFDDRHNLNIDGTPVLTSRGCPFQCSYCVNPVFNEIYKNKFIRFRSIPSVITEIENLVCAYNTSSFFIQDETFFIKKQRVIEFCTLYKKSIGMPFRCMGQATQIEEEVLSHLKEAGCHSISIGIEAGNPELRKNILKRNISDEQLIKVFTLARKMGIKTHSFNIIGLPYETKSNVMETLKLNLKCNPNSVQFTIMAPFKGSRIRDIYEKNDWIKTEKLDNYHNTTMIETSTLTAAQLVYLQHILPCLYFFHNRILLKLLAVITYKFIKPLPGLRFIRRQLIKYLDYKKSTTPKFKEYYPD